MAEVHVCDVVLGKAEAPISPKTLARAERKVGDLFACLTDLSCLRLGEPDWCLIAQGKALHLRIVLAPRRQLLLDLTLPGQRKLASLEEEAERVYAQLQQAQIKVSRLAAQFVARADKEPFLPDDPVSKMLLKHSSRQWRAKRLGSMVQLDFPQIQAATVDDECIQVRGIVDQASSRYLEIVKVSAPLGVGEVLPKLRLDRSGVDDQAWGELSRVGFPLSASVHLHRCLFTRRVIGSSLTKPCKSRSRGVGAATFG